MDEISDGGGATCVCLRGRCWTYETSVLLNTSIPNELPYNDFFEYYAPDFLLHLTPSSMENHNSVEALQVGGVCAVIGLWGVEMRACMLCLDVPISVYSDRQSGVAQYHAYHVMNRRLL